MTRGSVAVWVWVVAVWAIACSGGEDRADASSDSSPGARDGAASGVTVVDLSFFGSPYEGASVCVQDTCGVVGMDEQLLVRPPVRGPSFRLTVTLGEVQFDREVEFAETLAALGGDPEGAHTSRVSVALFRRASACAVYVTNHEVDGTVVTSTPPEPSLFEMPCGPFASSED